MAKLGRKSKYKPRYCRDIIKFFDIERCIEVPVTITLKSGAKIEKTEKRANPLPFFQDFAHKLGSSKKTLLEWCKKHKDFRKAYNIAKEKQEKFLAQNTLDGLYNSKFAIFTAKNILGWRDTQHLEGKGIADKQTFSIKINITGGQPGNSKSVDSLKKLIAGEFHLSKQPANGNRVAQFLEKS